MTLPKADANPTKAFFVRMITRDITLEDCILDLIDNSVDGAWRSEGSRPMGLAHGADLSGYSIEIAATPERFSITDNCGGMTLDDAINHAFSFGRKALDDHDSYSIGVYGIGMKRAIFKLGSEIRVRSTYREADGRREGFAIPIRVSEWLKDDTPPWDFDLEPDETLEANGVKIEISALTSAASTSFDSPAFMENLRRVIARDYSLHLNRGLRIRVNEVPVTGWNIQLRQSEDFKAVRYQYEDEVEGESVSVEIIGGMGSPPPESIDPTDDGEGDRRFGWYVVCNGRIVLAADKTSVSGWGSDWPQWHRQYSGFIGLILFTAENAAALPLTTTKRSVDVSSEVYRRARPRMREVTRSWIDYTNQRRQAIDEAKQREDRAAAVTIYDVPRELTFRVPTLTARPAEPVANVHYSVSIAKMKRLAKELGRINMPYREVGLKSFDYTYDDLVGDQ